MSEYERIVQVFDLAKAPPALLISTAISNVGGFLGYGLGLRQLIRRGTSPSPFWVHTFFIVHDSSFSYRCLTAAAQYDYHWFLVLYGAGLAAFTVQEAYTIYRFIFDARLRQETWGPYRPNVQRVSKSDAAFSALKQIAGFYAIFNYVYERFTPGPTGAPMFDWFILTIVCDTWAVVQTLRTRTWREDCDPTMVVQLAINAILAFSPWNMWVLAFPDLYDTVWYKAMGVVTVGVALSNAKQALSMPSEKGKGKRQ